MVLLMLSLTGRGLRKLWQEKTHQELGYHHHHHHHYHYRQQQQQQEQK
jgi:hypothetical protein